MKPTVRIDVYENDVFITHYEDDRETYHPAAVEDLAACFTNVAAASSYLPPNTLFWRRQAGVERVGIYVPPACYRLSWNGTLYKLPMPGFVFVGQGRTYWVFALKEAGYPTPATHLYAAPVPNIVENGHMCTGSVPFPECSPATVYEAFRAFVESPFTPHHVNGRCISHPNDVRALWEELAGCEEFPLEELRPSKYTLKDVIHANSLF